LIDESFQSHGLDFGYDYHEHPSDQCLGPRFGVTYRSPTITFPCWPKLALTALTTELRYSNAQHQLKFAIRRDFTATDMIAH
jgi:hypothetical protein